MTSSFDIRGTRFLPPVADGAPWTYLPLRPDLQRDAGGRPLLQLVESGASGYLMFSARWAAAEADLDVARDEIAARDRTLAPGRIPLSFAAVAAPRCHALIGDAGAFRPVASSDTSGFPPYDALFNLHLREEQLARARSGVRGEPGCLAIEYVAALQLPARATATFRANAGRLASWLRSPGADAGGSERTLEGAVAAGVATIVVDAPDPIAGALAAELHDRVLARAAERVPSLMRQDASGDLQVTVTLEQDVSIPTRAFADVGALVRAEAQRSLIGGHHAAD
jgi:hypothetical protein